MRTRCARGAHQRRIRSARERVRCFAWATYWYTGILGVAVWVAYWGAYLGVGVAVWAAGVVRVVRVRVAMVATVAMIATVATVARWQSRTRWQLLPLPLTRAAQGGTCYPYP